MLNFPGSSQPHSFSDGHHDILSIGQPPKHSLLSHVQIGPADPLALLDLGDSQNVPADSLLNNIVLEPASDSPAPASRSVIIEDHRRLSHSMLWQIQEDFYRNMGINAWEHNVPTFITSSAYIADHYAELIIAFLEDYWDGLDLSEPVYIVELATGTGRFSLMVLHELESKLACFEKTRALNWKYVMTDFTDSNPKFWSEHERLQPFIAKGRLDFAVMNPLAQDRLQLQVSGLEVSADTVRNPIIAIANYFFDTIPHDIFRVEAKQLKEGRVSLERFLETEEGPVDPESPPHISQIKPHWQYHDLHNDRYFEDERLNAVLRHYKHTVREGSIIFPTGAFQVLKNMEAMANGRLVLLSSDKAYTNVDYMVCFHEHLYAVHDGCFSYMVNYDAIGQAFRQAGGWYFHTDALNLSIQTVCCIALPGEKRRFERLDYLYKHRINRINTINSVCTMLPDGRDETPLLLMDRLLAQVRLHMADPRIFTLLGQELIAQLPNSSWCHREDLLKLMELAWERYYFSPGEPNLPFWLSQIYFHMDRFEESLFYLEKTLALFGDHEALYYLKGQSHEKLCQWRKALESYEKALDIKPEFKDAHQALLAVRHRVKPG